MKDSTISGSLSLRSDMAYVPDADATYSVEFNHNTKATMNLVHRLPKNTHTTYAAFSRDGKYLAAVSLDGIVHIFDAKTGKRLR